MDPVQETLSIGTLLIQTSIIASLGLYIAQKFGYGAEIWERVERYYSGYWKELSLGLALLATSGSLYFSNVLGYAPCHLCWFQRIFMYPLILLFGVSIYLRETVSEYAIPLATVGGGIAGYHYIIQRFDQFSSAGCSVTAVSCESTQIPFYYGYISIPIMAFTGFALILLLSWKYGNKI